MGYYRPVSHYNEWKKSEFYTRKTFKSYNEQFIEEYSK